MKLTGEAAECESRPTRVLLRCPLTPPEGAYEGLPGGVPREPLLPPGGNASTRQADHRRRLSTPHSCAQAAWPSNATAMKERGGTAISAGGGGGEGGSLRVR